MKNQNPVRKLAGFALVLCLFFLAATASAAPVRWISNPDEAALIRAEKKKPALIYFFNNQARPARQMQVETLDNELIQGRLADFVCVAINQEDHPDLSRDFKLVKVPTVIFLDSEGRELDRAIGFKPVETFVQYLDRISGAYKTKAAGSDVSPFKGSAIDILSSTAGTIATNLAFFAPDAKQVHIVGDFNDWRTDATPMNRAGNGFWNITLHLPAGVYEYMFLLDGQTYQVDVSNPFKKPNPYGANNSVLLVGQPRVSPTVMGSSVVFRVYQPNAQELSVAGSFNDWKSFTMFRNTSDPSKWGVRYDNLPPGTYQYKFIIDGVWLLDPENYSPEADGSGSINSSFTIR